VRVTEAALDVPKELVATTEYKVEASDVVSVPEMTQVEVLRLSPAGRAGVMTQLIIAWPLFCKRVGATDIATLISPTVPEAPA
jgi:hypothetical protein